MQAQVYLSGMTPLLCASVLTNPAYVARATSVVAELQHFGATATVCNVMLALDVFLLCTLPLLPMTNMHARTLLTPTDPHAATASDVFEVYTTVSSWYAVLPAGVRSLDDDVGRNVASLLLRSTGVRITETASGSVTARATATPDMSRSGTIIEWVSGNMTVRAMATSGMSGSGRFTETRAPSGDVVESAAGMSTPVVTPGASCSSSTGSPESTGRAMKVEVGMGMGMGLAVAGVVGAMMEEEKKVLVAELIGAAMYEVEGGF